MKKNSNVLVCVAGWEERFVAGLRVDVGKLHPVEIVVIVFKEFNEQTRASRASVKAYAADNQIGYRELEVSRRAEDAFKSLREDFTAHTWQDKDVTLDISTMPREVIWWSFLFFEQAGRKVDYVYHRPREYSKDWLTRDTATPRLVYQLSGIAQLGKPTALLLLNGFDAERAAHLVQFFEPSLLIVGVQRGEQFENEHRNIEAAEGLRQLVGNMRTFEIDAYSIDHGFSSIVEQVGPMVEKYNFVGASLGPKTSAVALYRVVEKFPQIALSYAPSRQFNIHYSLGIGDSIQGPLGPRPPQREEPDVNSAFRGSGDKRFGAA